MKKGVLLVITLLVLIIPLNAQFQYGLKAGINFSSLTIEDITGITDGDDIYKLVTGESISGYQAGIMTRFNILKFFIQPELYFNVVGGNIQQVYQQFNGSGLTTDLPSPDMLKVKFHRFDVPFLLGVKLGPARLNLGPVGSILVGSVNELVDNISPDFETLSKNLTWGFQAGVGLDLMKKLTLDVRYEGSLTQFGDKFSVGSQTFNFDARPRQFIIAAGWWF